MPEIATVILGSGVLLLLGIVSNLLALSQIPSFWVQAAYGALIVAALLLARLSGQQEID